MWSHWGLETSDWNDGKRLEVVGFCCFLWRLSALTSGSVTFVWQWLQEPSHNVNKCVSKITAVFIVGIVLTHSWTLQTTKLPEHLLHYRWIRISQNPSVWLSMSQYVWGSVQTAADYRFETSSVCVSSACSCNMTWVCVFVFSRYTSSWYTCCLLWREDSHCRYQWRKWILLILLDQVFFHNNKCAAQRREKQSRSGKKVGNTKCSQINGAEHRFTPHFTGWRGINTFSRHCT